MLKVNGKMLEWKAGITFPEIYRQIGYTIRSPRVLVRVDGETVAKKDRDSYEIKDESVIEIINTLCGG